MTEDLCRFCCLNPDCPDHGKRDYGNVYNFCWPVRTLRVPDGEGRWQQRTRSMAAGLTDHVWSLREWLTLPACQRQ